MSGRTIRNVIDALERLFATPPARDVRRLFVAYSGGADSTALLLGVAAWRERRLLDCHAFHFDHRLHPDSATWAAHCRARCATLAIPFHLAVAIESPAAGASLEAWARDQRYAAAAGLLAAGDALLTAHHRDDLAETFLLAALRGSGPHGLAAIAPRRPLGAGLLLRPLLELSRATLVAVVTEAGLDYLEDPANADPRHDRSYLRGTVMPLLEQRFPGVGARFGRAVALQRATADLLDADTDAALGALGATATTLPLCELAARNDMQVRLILRRWLQRASGRAPTATILTHALRDLVHSRRDAMPLLAWQGGELRRHRDTLHWLATPPVPFTVALDWAMDAPLVLSGGVLRARRTVGAGLRATLVRGALSVRPRRGGEMLRPAGRAHVVSVKRLLQEADIPSWRRRQIPLIWAGDRLVAVGDLAIAAEAAADAGDEGVTFDFERV